MYGARPSRYGIIKNVVWKHGTIAVSSKAMSSVPVTSRKIMKILISLSKERSSHTIICKGREKESSVSTKLIKSLMQVCDNTETCFPLPNLRNNVVFFGYENLQIKCSPLSVKQYSSTMKNIILVFFSHYFKSSQAMQLLCVIKRQKLRLKGWLAVFF